MAAEIRGDVVVLRPRAPEDTEALRAIHVTPEVSEWWGPMADDFPDDEPETTRYTIWHEDRIAGLIQHGEEPDADYRHAWIDIYIDPRVRGRGIGTDALRALVRHLGEAHGHHRITIDPALENPAAIRSYEKAGFRRVGVLEAAWRDGHTGTWRDSLLMEHVVRPATTESGGP